MQDIHTIVVVYQFGKVASTSVVNAINSAPGFHAIQSHLLGADCLMRVVPYICDPNTSDYAAQVEFDQLSAAFTTTRMLNQVRDGTGPRKRFVLVTLVREPLSWFRSAILQDLPRYMVLFRGIGRTLELGDPEAEADALSACLLVALRWLSEVAERIEDLANIQWGDHRLKAAVDDVVPKDLHHEFLSLFFVMIRPLRWFDTHYTSATGITLTEFQPYRRGMWKRDPDWVNAYLIRYEDLQEGYLALRDDLGLPAEAVLPQDNVSATKPHSQPAAQAFSSGEADRLRRTLGRCDYARFFGYRQPAQT
ncbi:hypothetical protein ACRDNQ_10465 [Palleronia sp. KMU-117]|uniref:hypothetical protein n=1 Tax=Palleronia sp. KMU-117 TaxID=3434108 RepID=UPI003D7554DB